MRPSPGRTVLASAATILFLVLAGCAQTSSDEQTNITSPLPSKGDLLFVMRGEGQVADGRLTLDGPLTEWFTDRPVRRAGFAHTGELVRSWGKFGFDGVPPNAVLTGDGVDAVVALTKPREDSDGTSFAFDAVRGSLASGHLGPVTLFIDGTGPVHTKMHVMAQGSWCKKSWRSKLSDPQIVQAPTDWYRLPKQSVHLGDRNGDGVVNRLDRVTLFVGGAEDQRTHFEVSYSASCGHSPRGTVTLDGSIPSAWYNAKRFSCSYSNLPGAQCSGYPVGLYHPRGVARIGNPL